MKISHMINNYDLEVLKLIQARIRSRVNIPSELKIGLANIIDKNERVLNAKSSRAKKKPESIITYSEAANFNRLSK